MGGGTHKTAVFRYGSLVGNDVSYLACEDSCVVNVPTISMYFGSDGELRHDPIRGWGLTFFRLHLNMRGDSARLDSQRSIRGSAARSKNKECQTTHVNIHIRSSA